jgi:hypothetical protein
VAFLIVVGHPPKFCKTKVHFGHQPIHPLPPQIQLDR